MSARTSRADSRSPAAWIAACVLLVALVAGLLIGTNASMGIGLAIAGVVCLGWFVSRPAAATRTDMDEVSGPGWLVGKLIGLLPGGGAKAAAIVIATLMIAGGVFLAVAG